MIHSFRPNKDTLLFNIKNIPLHLFNFIYKDFKVLLYLKNGIQSGHSLVFLQ